LNVPFQHQPQPCITLQAELGIILLIHILHRCPDTLTVFFCEFSASHILHGRIESQNLIVNRLEVFFSGGNENKPGLLIDAFDNPAPPNVYFF
jgi:hypothetical protein